MLPLVVTYLLLCNAVLVGYIVWAHGREVSVLRSQIEAYRKTLFLHANLSTQPFDEVRRESLTKRGGVPVSEPEEEVEPEPDALAWETSLDGLNRQAYGVFKRQMYEELALTSPEEIYQVYRSRHGSAQPFDAMKLG